MRGLRAILLNHRRLALWLIALALAMKALVPAGYMVDRHDKVLQIAICGDASGLGHLTQKIVVPGRESPSDQGAQHVKGSACPFTALAMAGTAGADPVLLGLALAFILAVGLAPRAIVLPRARTFLRPPLRGPPALS